MNELIKKYSYPVPRYTSYPTVPDWDMEAFSREAYLERLRAAFALSTTPGCKGMALYIHLPYCESLCTYCGCNTRITVNHKVEGPYIDAVLQEWRMYLALFAESTTPGSKPLIREIHLGGGTPTFFAPEQLQRLIVGIADGCTISPDASFSFEAHPANTTEAHLRTLRKLGFDRLSLGVQDFDPLVQKAIHRFQSAEEVATVTQQARDLGYRSVNFDLVYGLPFQRAEAFAETLKEVLRMRPDRIAFYGYAHVPWKHPGQRAYDENDLPPAADKLALFMAGRDAFVQAGYESIGLDHFALPDDSLTTAYRAGTMHRNFMGYTDLRTDVLIGLGVSSIGDVGTAYAQNAKSVEAYREKVGRGEWPIAKGHLLDAQEHFIAQHILNLMCKHRTSWADTPCAESEYLNCCLPRLREMAADGLLQMSDNEVCVTDQGRILVRNVCAVIDKYYQPIEGKRQFAAAI